MDFNHWLFLAEKMCSSKERITLRVYIVSLHCEYSKYSKAKRFRQMTYWLSNTDSIILTHLPPNRTLPNWALKPKSRWMLTLSDWPVCGIGLCRTLLVRKFWTTAVSSSHRFKRCFWLSGLEGWPVKMFTILLVTKQFWIRLKLPQKDNYKL